MKLVKSNYHFSSHRVGQISPIMTVTLFISLSYIIRTKVKPLSNRHSQKDRKLVFFLTNSHLMQVKSIEECSKWSILQYFRPALSYYLSLRSLFCLFLSGHFTQVLLYFEDLILVSILRGLIITIPLTGPGVCLTFLRCMLVFQSGSGDSSFFGVSGRL